MAVMENLNSVSGLCNQEMHMLFEKISIPHRASCLDSVNRKAVCASTSVLKNSMLRHTL